MKRLVVTLVLAGALLLVAVSTGSAKGGPDRVKLESAGWMCFDPPPLPGELPIVHCVHPNTDIDALFAGALASVPSSNFDLAGNFLGTEILIRADLGDDERPCNQGTEADGTYQPVDFSGDGEPEYFSCHHNNEV